VNAKQHLERVGSMGCIVCINEGRGPTPADVHHILDIKTNKRIDHYHTLPLCFSHHRAGINNRIAISRHNHLRAFEARYGTELELLTQVLKRLAVHYPEDYDVTA